MKSFGFTVLFLINCLLVTAQQKTAEEFQQDLNQEFANPEETPLTEDALAEFKELPFFRINNDFIVNAKFVRAEGSTPFEMKTTTDRRPIYEKYGEAHFDLEGESFVLTIYQSHKSRDSEQYKNYLFLPFTDATNGEETYGGGRFIDLLIPNDNSILIDFNQAYNPLCAYNKKYSCPIPPTENDIAIRIEAGVQYESDH